MSGRGGALDLGRALILTLILTLASGARAADFDALPSIQVESVEVLGVKAFSSAQIEPLVELGPGDRLDRAKVVGTAENIRDFYRQRGYERVAVKTRLQGRALEIQVEEGDPVRIAGVRFVASVERPDLPDKFWRELSAELRPRLGFAVGDVMDQDRITQSRRIVLDALSGADYVTAHIDEIRATQEDKARPNEVTLEYRLDPGNRVLFTFRGNQEFTIAKLNSWIEEMRVLGFSQDYVGAIVARIKQEYQAIGFAEVRVTPYSFENAGRRERQVSFHIEEGIRAELDEVDFDGNAAFDDESLRREFYARASSLVQHGYYVDKDVQHAAELTVEWMKSRGYLAAKLVTISTLEAIRPKRAGPRPLAYRSVIYLYEGEQTIFRRAEFVGLTVFTPDEVKAILGLREGEPLNLFTFGEGLDNLKIAYRNRAYLDFKLANAGESGAREAVVRYSDENRVADVKLVLAEGHTYTVADIQIEGLGRTQEVVVRREVRFRPGDLIRENEVGEAEARLRRLGIFGVVSVRLVDYPEKPGTKVLKISLQEGTPGIIAGGPGFRSDLGFRAFAQVAYTNLFGLNQTLGFSLVANHRIGNFFSLSGDQRIEQFRFVEYEGQLSYIDPWFLGHDLVFRPTVTVSGTQYMAFDATTISAALTWEKRLIQNPALTATFSYSIERVNQFNSIDPQGIDNQLLRIGTLTPGFRFDTRDNPLGPTRGWFFQGTLDYAAPWLFSQSDPFPIGYYRVQGRVDKIIPITRDISWFLSFRGGFERSNEAPVNDASGNEIAASGAIPLIKQFALGGAGSLRGFAEQELNVQNINVRGSASYANYRTQVDFPLSGSLRFGPFLDGANLLLDNSSIGKFFFDHVRFGVGAGFHYQTPVGPVNLDWGFKVNPQPGEDVSRIYFSIGLI